MAKPLHVIGLHGLGDNLHQRAVVRQLIEQGHDVWLETSWPCLYHDMPADRLHFVARGTNLRTQLKNASREADEFSTQSIPSDARQMRVHYSPAQVKAKGSVLGAMAASCGLRAQDFRMDLHSQWQARADLWLEENKPCGSKPLLIYRPLVERKEWTGCANRNPDAQHYADLISSIRDRFWCLSIADIVPGTEWIASQPIEPDLARHGGELDVELLAGIFRRASLVVAAPGFAIVLAQALGTPSVPVFGGYEDGRSFSFGAKFTPTCVIQPIAPCGCWSHTHRCAKQIDMPKAKRELQEFVNANCSQSTVNQDHAALV